MVSGRVGGFSSVGQHGLCRFGGPKGLFLFCNFLCSLGWDKLAIFGLEVPKDTKKLRSFLGLVQCTGFSYFTYHHTQQTFES